ncbi:HCP-like protein [Choiromyces venosus 120613-1]|uniref:HCP-like protein n=1 Tax=Choiromyces venosus 120613-1 TaxID=1336337 RepID=A0A3N4K8W3_9PEZI|nr:HCP-like protein [Choiromyces venosus 120613-1]
MTFRNIFKKDGGESSGTSKKDGSPPPPQKPQHPEFTFIRSDTNTRDVLNLPDHHNPQQQDKGHLSLDRPHSSGRPKSPLSGSRLSFSTLSSSRRRSNSSAHVPADLPDISLTGDKEQQWELRAAKLAQGGQPSPGIMPRGYGEEVVAHSDDNIQEAIRLHEAGELKKSTEIFGRLADPNGPNNPLSQVLYGLALRHGWGIEPNLPRALTYLQSAARNSAAVEELALKAGMTKGGSAKGELVLAIFELGNCFRHGWGVQKDPAAAREYYETAANLGDADAMNEVAWCYLEGFGCRKDKMKSAMFYRMAEKQGNKILGNTWIYKDKYMTGD